MTVRETSRAVYREIKESGLLSRRRLEVYTDLFRHGPVTANELYKKMDKNLNINQMNITTRLGELRDMGCVSEVSKRRCKVTGKRVIVWDCNKNLPTKLPVKKTKLQKAKQEILELKEEVRKYKKLFIKYKRRCE